jgi:hypothetical protein
MAANGPLTLKFEGYRRLHPNRIVVCVIPWERIKSEENTIYGILASAHYPLLGTISLGDVALQAVVSELHEVALAEENRDLLLFEEVQTSDDNGYYVGFVFATDAKAMRFKLAPPY